MKEKIALVLALGVAVLAVVGLRQYLERRENAMFDEETVAVVSALRDLPAGTVLTDLDLAQRRIPRRFRPSSCIDAADLSHAPGKPLLRARRKGEAILWLDLPEPGRGLSRGIPAGERAVAISVDDTAGLAGLLKPGDRVDVIGVFQAESEDGETRRGRVARTLLTNMTVLAVGQATREEEAAPGDAATVTLAAAPAEAALLALARHAAQLALALRNPEDVETPPMPEVREAHLRDPELLREWMKSRRERIEIDRKGAQER